MAQSYVDKVANELADLALADQAASGDMGIVDMIGSVLGASSQTLQETYLTAIRVRRAEERARAILAERLANGFKAPPKPTAAPLQGLSEEADEGDIAENDAAAVSQAPEADAPEPVSPATNMPRRVKR